MVARPRGPNQPMYRMVDALSLVPIIAIATGPIRAIVRERTAMTITCHVNSPSAVPE